MRRMRTALLVGLILSILLMPLDGRTIKKKRMSKLQREMKQLKERETNPVNFTRLVIMRLIYGLASTMGLSENLSGVLNGAFVPPGVDDYSDYADIIDDDY